MPPAANSIRVCLHTNAFHGVQLRSLFVLKDQEASSTIVWVSVTPAYFTRATPFSPAGQRPTMREERIMAKDNTPQSWQEKDGRCNVCGTEFTVGTLVKDGASVNATSPCPISGCNGTATVSLRGN